MSGLEPSDRAPGLLAAPGVEIPEDAEVGANVILYPGVVLIESGCRIQDGAVIGKGAVLGPTGARPRRAPGASGRCSSAARPVGCHAVRRRRRHLGAGAVVARTTRLIREGARLEDGAVVGHGARASAAAAGIGAGSRLMPGALLATDTVIEGGRVLRAAA